MLLDLSSASWRMVRRAAGLLTRPPGGPLACLVPHAAALAAAAQAAHAPATWPHACPPTLAQVYANEAFCSQAALPRLLLPGGGPPGGPDEANLFWDNFAMVSRGSSYDVRRQGSCGCVVLLLWPRWRPQLV